MTKDEFAKLYGFDEEDMDRITTACVVFNGLVASVESKNQNAVS